MNAKEIGIILPRRLWKGVIEHQIDMKKDDSIIFQYAKRGLELNLKVYFFSIDELKVNELIGNAFVIEDDKVIEKHSQRIPSIVYSPINYHRKKNIKLIMKLSQQKGITVINERNSIKQMNFTNLIESQSDLKELLNVRDEAFESPLIFHVLGQKNLLHQWDIPIIYAKNSTDEIYSFDEAYQLLNLNHEKQNVLKEKMFEASFRIFELIHYYYPGMFEIGLTFRLNDDQSLTIQGNSAIEKIVKDLKNWDQDIYEIIVQWPIELAKVFHENKNLHGETETNLPYHEEPAETIQNGNNTDHSSRHKMNLWVKFKEVQDDEMIVKLPHRIAYYLKEQPEAIKFGVMEETCQVHIYEDEISLRDNSFQFPAELFISSSLVKKMHIPLDLVYQIQFFNGKVIIGPTIGFLLGYKSQTYNLDNMEKFNDRFGEFHRIGGLVIAFSPRSVDWDKKIAYGMIYDPQKKHWRYDSAPIPSTIYRRNFHHSAEHINRLVEMTDHNLFNSYHFKKSDLYLLKEEPEIEEHLPATFLLKDLDELIDFLKKTKKIILKPANLSRGRGIFILEVCQGNKEGFIFYDYRNKMRVQHWIKDVQGIKLFLGELGILNQEYLFQTYISLLKIKSRAFDVRVVMQKYNKKKWLCSGIECRVASENEELTNIARGGKAMTLKEVINTTTQGLSYSFVHRSILQLCQRFCRLMDQSNQHFAEFGLDIALDEKGYPWILEANIYPSFKGFKYLDYDTYLRIRYQPLFYAVQIQGFQIEDNDPFDSPFHYKKRYY